MGNTRKPSFLIPNVVFSRKTVKSYLNVSLIKSYMKPKYNVTEKQMWKSSKYPLKGTSQPHSCILRILNSSVYPLLDKRWLRSRWQVGCCGGLGWEKTEENGWLARRTEEDYEQPGPTTTFKYLKGYLIWIICVLPVSKGEVGKWKADFSLLWGRSFW